MTTSRSKGLVETSAYKLAYKLDKTSPFTIVVPPVYPMGEKLSDLLDALKKGHGAPAPKAPPTVPKCGFCGGSGRVRVPGSPVESCSACAGTGMILQGGAASPPASPPPAVVRPLTLAERLKQKQEAPAAAPAKPDPPRYPSGDPPPGAPWEEPVHTLARIGDREIDLRGYRTCEEAKHYRTCEEAIDIDEIGVDVTCDGAGVVRGVHVYIPVSRMGITNEVFNQLTKMLGLFTEQRIWKP